MSNWQQTKKTVGKNAPADTKLLKSLRVGIVTGRFNDHITGALRDGVLKVLKQNGMSDSQIHSVDVPGAFEIPLASKWLFQFQKCDGVIALGCVIRGETPHFDYVCQAVERGLTTLQLEQSRPVVFGILTTDNEEQAKDRIGGRHGHKGEEAAEVFFEMMNLKKQIKTPTKPKKGVPRGANK